MGVPHTQAGIAVSLNGGAVAMGRGDSYGSLWLRNFERDSESLFAENAGAPVWSADGRIIVYSKGDNLYGKDATGGGVEVPLLQSGNRKYASDWSRDGRFLLYTELDPKTGGDIWYLPDPLDTPGGSKPVRFPGTEAVESQAQLSRDGRWVAYSSGTEVYVRPFPSGSGQWKVSTHGGAQPRWSADGKEIYYIERGGPLTKVMAASARTGTEGTLNIGVPQMLFEIRANGWASPLTLFSYSPGPGGRFLADVATDTTRPTINIITNWQKLLTGTKQQ